MKTLSEIRRQLLTQHADIRREIDAVRVVCQVLPLDRAKLGAVLRRLGELLHEHNVAEEDALQNVLPDLDAFGEVRKAVMLSEHRAEHEDLRKTLTAAGGRDSTATVDHMLTLLDRMTAHMSHEEDLFLSARLLSPP